MTDADGLVLAALLQGASLLLVGIGYFYTRELIRTPAALSAIAASALGSFLLVRHAPPGPVWTPEPWSGTQMAAGKGLKLHFPVRQGPLEEVADRRGPDKALNLRQPGRGAGESEEEQSASGDAPADGSGASQTGRAGALLSLLFSFERARAPSTGDTGRDCPHCPELVVVPAGSYMMGAEAGDSLAMDAEKPARPVRFWPGFAIGAGEVSVAEYQYFAHATGRAMPGCAGAVTAPVACVSWNDAAAYVAWLRRTTGKAYRLPTAAEWEYATRAGAQGRVEVASLGPRLAAGATLVDQVRGANAWNISGMGGNVAELVADCWRPSLTDTDLDVDAALWHAHGQGRRHERAGALAAPLCPPPDRSCDSLADARLPRRPRSALKQA